jgi:hypothetical protein
VQCELCYLRFSDDINLKFNALMQKRSRLSLKVFVSPPGDTVPGKARYLSMPQVEELQPTGVAAQVTDGQDPNGRQEKDFGNL